MNDQLENNAEENLSKMESDVPFVTTPVKVEQTSEFVPLPWSKQNAEIAVNKVEVTQVSSIAGELAVSAENEVSKEPVADDVDVYVTELVDSEVEVDAGVVVGAEKLASESDANSSASVVSETLVTKTEEKVAQPVKTFSEENKDSLEEAITRTATNLPKIFNEDAPVQPEPEFTAPVEINEVESTMIRRRSLMGEGRQINEDGYNDNHVRLAWQPLKQEEEKTEEEKLETILDGATVYPTLPSRAAAHWWSVFMSLLALPLAWYLLNDSVTTLSKVDFGKLQLGFGLYELLAGVVLLAVFLLVTQFSSVGAFIAGTVAILASIPFLFLPSQTAEFFKPVLLRAENVNEIVGNIFHFFVANASNGLLLIFGISLFFVGFVAHTARRLGRREQQIRNDLGIVGVDDKIAKKAKKAAIKAEKAEAKAKHKLAKSD